MEQDQELKRLLGWYPTAADRAAAVREYEALPRSDPQHETLMNLRRLQRVLGDPSPTE